MAYQAGIAESVGHLAEILDRFLLGGGIPEETPDGLHYVPGANTGDGGVFRILGTPSSVTETITITLTSATTFTVSGSVTGALPGGTVDVAYTSTVLDFIVRSGPIAFVASDSFTIDITQSPLVAAAPSQVWTKRLPADAGTLGQPEQRLIYEGPGYAGTDSILVGVNFVESTVAQGISLEGMATFNSANNWDAQVGGLTFGSKPTSCGWSLKMPYWLVGDGRSFAMYWRVGSQYQGISGGFLQPIALPAEWPYPLYVGACNYANFGFDYNAGAPSPWWSPGVNVSSGTAFSMYVRDWESTWHGVANWVGTTRAHEDDLDGWHTWPYWEEEGDSGGEYARSLWGGVMSGPKGEQYVMPITLMRSEGANQGILAQLPHVYWCSTGEKSASNDNPEERMTGSVRSPLGFESLHPEDEILVTADRYKLFPFPLRQEFRAKTFCAMKLE